MTRPPDASPVDSALAPFHPLIRRWFVERLGAPTDIQRQAWPEIAAGRHVLVIAPTGCGKTLTAFLWAINRLLTAADSAAAGRILYISPLKALNNDIQRNLQRPLAELREYFAAAGLPFPEIRVDVRSGDSPPDERRRMQRRPGQIFITTPESLNVMLTSPTGRRSLAGFTTVILDEIHAVVPGKRGTWLITAVERLAAICGEFQRIALSATVHPAEIVADFVGGRRMLAGQGEAGYEKRPVRIVRSTTAKRYDLQVAFPAEISGGPSETGRWWPALVQEIRSVIERNRSTLIFANSRRMVEKITRFLNEVEGDRVYSHHGSLAREIRQAVEQRFKNGELAAIVATSSLELGIDIGSVDETVLIQPPFSVASAMQRIGRAGHGVGQVSKGTFFALHGQALLEAAVMAGALGPQAVEPMQPVQAPLDVLAQVLLSMTTAGARHLDELYDEIRCSWPYRELPREEFDRVVGMLAGKYSGSRVRELQARLLVDGLSGTARARENVPPLLYMSGGVIPDRGYYTLRLAGTKAKIGELDEEFVWERSVGDTFPLGNNIWRIRHIGENDVDVEAVDHHYGLVPFWRAEEMNRPYHFSQRIGDFLAWADKELESPDFRDRLMERHHLSDAAARALQIHLRRQKEESGAPLPQRGMILAENLPAADGAVECRQIILHTLWGGGVNRPLALALAAAFQERFGRPLEYFVNNDGLLLTVPHELGAAALLELVPPERLRPLLRQALPTTAFFGARFRENAQRALLLPRAGFQRRTPLWFNRMRAKKLLAAVSAYDDFPVVQETWRECLQREFELDTLQGLLEEWRGGLLQVREVHTERPTPFAGNLVWKQTNQAMYESDAGGGAATLDEALLRDVLYAGHLRPRFGADLLERFQDKLQRTAPGYPPASAEELLQWLRERLFIPAAEWNGLVRAMRRDHGEAETAAFLSALDGFLVTFTGEADGLDGVAALETLPRLRRWLPAARGVAAAPLPVADDEEEENDSPSQFLAEWLRFYGPLPPACARRALALTAEEWDEALSPLLEDGRVILDEFRETDPEMEICDSANLEILLRLRRRAARPAFAPLPLEHLPLFLAAWQGVLRGGEQPADFRQRLEKLFGYPARAGLWESDILPARSPAYRLEWLEENQREYGLLWLGCGEERITFCLESDVELFRGAVEAEAGDGEIDEALERLLAAGGRFELAELAQALHRPSAEVSAALWRLAWLGRVGNDHFRVVRNGVMNRFRSESAVDPSGGAAARRRPGFSRWQATRAMNGRWFLLPQTAEWDALDRQEIVKDRVRQLLLRYGVVFRELLANEGPELRWGAVFPTLRLLELSGEIVGGPFFQGIEGLQFALPAVAEQLPHGLPQQEVFWLNAADPASLCGLGPEALRSALPHRLPTTHLIYHGERLVLVSQRLGADLSIRVQPDDPALPSYLALFDRLLERECQPPTRIRVETVNDTPVFQSPYKAIMQESGFEADYRYLTRRKRY